MYETVGVPVALGKMRVATRWEVDHRKYGIRARLVAREFKGDETMYDVFAPSSTPSIGRIIDDLSLKKSYHTFIADVTNAYFHLDGDEACYVVRSRPHRGIQPPCIGGCGINCMVVDALEHAGWTSWQNASVSKALTDVMRLHSSGCVHRGPHG